jgi:hypothetical protein
MDGARPLFGDRIRGLRPAEPVEYDRVLGDLNDAGADRELFATDPSWPSPAIPPFEHLSQSVHDTCGESQPLCEGLGDLATGAKELLLPLLARSERGHDCPGSADRWAPRPREPDYVGEHIPWPPEIEGGRPRMRGDLVVEPGRKLVGVAGAADSAQ